MGRRSLDFAGYGNWGAEELAGGTEGETEQGL